MTRIKLGRVSRALGAPAEILRGLGLREYTWSGDADEPAAFIGVYYSDDIETIRAHRGHASVLFCGADARRIRTRDMRSIRDCARIICQPGVAKDLCGTGIEPDVVRPVYLGDLSLFSTTPPLGEAVYCYLPYERQEEYGLTLVADVARQLPGLRFMLGRWGTAPLPFPNAEATPIWWPMAAMPRIYARCFCGVRTVRRDALGCGLIELAAMGRPVAHVIGTGLPFVRVTPVANEIVDLILAACARSAPDLALADAARSLAADDSWLLI